MRKLFIVVLSVVGVFAEAQEKSFSTAATGYYRCTRAKGGPEFRLNANGGDSYFIDYTDKLKRKCDHISTDQKLMLLRCANETNKDANMKSTDLTKTDLVSIERSSGKLAVSKFSPISNQYLIAHEANCVRLKEHNPMVGSGDSATAK